MAALDEILKARTFAKVGTDDGEERLRSGIFGDLFDFISRPSSAVNTAIRYGTDNNSSTSALSGLGQGISGRTQTSFSDVLKDKGASGPGAAIGGLAGDILLDPMTYLGLKKTKGVSSVDAVMQAFKSGAPDVDAYAANLLAKNPSRIGLTVLGRPIHKGIKTPNTGLVEKLLGPATERNSVAKAFSRSAELPEGLNEMSRVIDSAHNAKFNDFRMGVKNTFNKNLTHDERVEIYKAIETGTDLSHVTVTNPTAQFKNLGDYQRLVKTITDDQFKLEADMGLYGEEAKNLGFASNAYDPNYMYKFFNNPPKNLTGSKNFKPLNKRALTLDAAEQAGYEPIKDIAEILDLRTAKHHRMVQRGAFVRDATDKFGVSKADFDKLPKDSPIRKMGWVTADSVDSPVTKGRVDQMIPNFVAKSVNDAHKVFETGEVANSVINGYTKALGQWKFWNTALPGTQIRNMFGDWINNVSDGVTNPTRYGQAAKVLKDVQQITTDRMTGAAGTYGKIKLGGKEFSSDEVWDLFAESGAKSGMITTELMRSINNTERRLISQQGSKLKAAWGEKIDLREDWMRMAHFIDSLDKRLSSNPLKGVSKQKFASPKEAAMAAGADVRKYNVDYGNLSSYEKKVITKVIPFYSWMRRATPLNMELLFTKPGFMTLYPKSQNAIQELLGTDDGTGEQLIPEWIKDTAPVRLALAKNNPLNGLLKMLGVTPNEPGFLSTTVGTTPFDTLDLPLEPLGLLAKGDLMGAVRSPIADITQQITPAVKLPVELTTGKSMFTGQDLEGNWASWLASQTAPTRGIDKGIQQNPAGAIANSLLGLPIQVATASRQEGEFNRRQDAKQQKTRDIKVSSLQERFGNYDDLPEARREALLKGMRSPRDPEATQQRRYLTQILGQ